MLTGGGDCPGLNAVIRAIVRKGVEHHGHEFVGYRDGWRGPLDGHTVPLDTPAVRGILPDSLVTVVSVQWFGSEAIGQLDENVAASDGAGLPENVLAEIAALQRSWAE